MSKRSHTSYADWNLYVGGNRTVLMGSFHPGAVHHSDPTIFHLEKIGLGPDSTNKMDGEASLIFTGPEKIDRFIYKKSRVLDIGLMVANKSGLLDAAEGIALIARLPHEFMPLKDTHIDFRGHGDEQMVVTAHSKAEAASAVRQLVGMGAVDLKTAARSFVWSAYQAQDTKTPFEFVLPIPKGQEASVVRSIAQPPSLTNFVTSQPMVLHHQSGKNLVDAIRDIALDISGVCRLEPRGPAKEGYGYLGLAQDTLERLSPVAQQMLGDPKERYHDFPERGGRY